MKELYRFQLYREVDKTVTEPGPEAGTTITKTVKEKEPVTFILKKPSRLEKEEADLFYSVVLSGYTKSGLLTKAMLARQYKDTGGTLSEAEKKRVLELFNQMQDLQKEAQLLAIAEGSEDAKKLNRDKLSAVRRELIELQNYQDTLYQNTADSKADNKVVVWLMLMLTYIEKDGKPVPYFGGATYEEKLADYDRMEEAEDPLFFEVVDKLSIYFPLYYAGVAMKPEDFAALEKESVE